MLSSKNSNSQLKQKINKKHSQELIFKSQDIRKKKLFPALGIFSIPIYSSPSPLSELMHTKIAKTKTYQTLYLKNGIALRFRVQYLLYGQSFVYLNLTRRVDYTNQMVYHIIEQGNQPSKQPTN